MIDTIRFLIPVSAVLFESVRSNSRETTRFNHKIGALEMHYWIADTELGSYNKKLNIFCSDMSPDHITIELSIPKFAYGHNIFLIYQSQLKNILEELRTELGKVFGVFPDIALWKILRLDLCYAWKYRTQAQAEEIMSSLRSFKYPRKRVYRYDTSVMHIGSSYSLKWYLKQPEFFNHDFKELKKTDIGSAYQLLGFAEGVVRFEVTLRPASFKTHFGTKNLFIPDLLASDLEKKLQFFFNKSMEFKGDDLLTSTDIFLRLKKRFQSSIAIRLYTFFLACNSSEPEDKKNVYSALSQSQIRRNILDLKRAGVGLLVTTTDPAFSLAIPSPFATSDDPSSEL